MKRAGIVLSRDTISVPRLLLFSSILCGLLVFIVLFTALDNQFVAFDDYDYVLHNRTFSNFNWNTVVGYFSSFYLANWHPVTMLSFAFDFYLWGLDPFGFHLTNIVLHCATVAVVCQVYYILFVVADINNSERNTRPAVLVFGSVVSTLYFGMHPLRVESVVWISERKDVLCLFFLITALWWYLRYVSHSLAAPSRAFWCFRSYWVVIVLAGLAAMSKPTAVSLPIVLCIIDWFPLGRYSDRASFKRSTIDKLPLILISILIAVLTLLAQQASLRVHENIDLVSRLMVACKALVFYLQKTIWPSNLAAFYIHPGNVSALEPEQYFKYLIIVAVSLVAAVIAGRYTKFWPAILCYYLVTIAPMLGLLQVGGQWVADRYSYLPSLGLSLIWGSAAIILLRRYAAVRSAIYLIPLMALVIFPLLVYTFLTVQQIQVWSNTEALATRIISVQPHQYAPAYLARAKFRSGAGRQYQALEDVDEALRLTLRQNIREPLAGISFERARILQKLGRIPEALLAAEWASEMSKQPLSAEDIGLYKELQKQITAVQ